MNWKFFSLFLPILSCPVIGSQLSFTKAVVCEIGQIMLMIKKKGNKHQKNEKRIFQMLVENVFYSKGLLCLETRYRISPGLETFPFS